MLSAGHVSPDEGGRVVQRLPELSTERLFEDQHEDYDH